MSRATDLAQEQYKTGKHSPEYRLEIAGEHFNDELYDATATYSADGGSELSISADTNLTELTGAKVRLEVGYGTELWPWFGGWLEDPEDNHWGEPSTATAYGPFREMGEGSFGVDKVYASTGYLLGPALVDMHTRAGRAVAGIKYEILGNPSVPLEGKDAAVGISTTFADGITTLIELAGWVQTDRPEFRRLYMPRPRPRPTGPVVASYDESQYPAKGFQAIRSKPYGSVGAFARDDEGKLRWPIVKVRVDSMSKYKPSELRTLWLEDYLLDEASAKLECVQLAALMEAGVYRWSLTGISANPDLLLHDIIRVGTTETRDEGGRFKERYECEYACAIDSEISLDVSREGHPMSASGETAIRLSQRHIKRPFYFARGLSAVVK